MFPLHAVGCTTGEEPEIRRLGFYEAADRSGCPLLHRWRLFFTLECKQSPGWIGGTFLGLLS